MTDDHLFFSSLWATSHCASPPLPSHFCSPAVTTHHHHFLCSGFSSFVDSICAWQRVFSKGSLKTRHLAFAWLQLCSLSIVGHLLLLLLGGGGGLLREQVQLGQELFLLLGPSILVQEGHGLHLPFHPGTVGADEHVVLGVALGQPLLGK